MTTSVGTQTLATAGDFEPAAFFVAELSSAGRARQFVRRSCPAWADGAVVEVAALLTSELVANAVVHAHSPAVVALSVSEGTLRVAVTDMGGSALVMDRDRQLGEGGRGLPLVDALSVSWGVTPLALGKTVWFTLRAPPPAG
jgi:anti-sigma regulatory factor (Ser/Thr protein kinase)